MNNGLFNWLKSAIQMNNNLMNTRIYKEILNKRSDGDFSTVDVHFKKYLEIKS
ncbi:hypothetical protein SAMN05192559_1078 [Halobacillus karajensis]|nr:hypothetical protein SAMN05192559_1078 [Halobacillus karajensis]